MDNEYESDLRNKKYGVEEGKWSKQSFNKNELRRVNYIKEKKDKQRQDQLEKQQASGNFGMIVEEDDGECNKRKRELKSNKKNNVVDQEVEEEEIAQLSTGKKAKNFYKSKK